LNYTITITIIKFLYELDSETVYKLILKDYEKYPFLESFSACAATLPQMQLPLIRLMETQDGKKALELARLRVLLALNQSSDPTNIVYDKDVKIKINSTFPSILSYGMSRMIVSCTSPSIIHKYATSEVERAIRLLSSEQPHIKEAVESELNFRKDTRRILIKDYVPLHLTKYGSEYKLVNCILNKGFVNFTNTMNITHIIREKIRLQIMRKMPLTVNPDVKEIFGPIISEITSQYDKSNTANFGEVDDDSFPPCIKNIIAMISKHENPTHAGRFAMVSFCNKIGMEPTEIVTLFQTVKDFQVGTTLYQVEHILGKHGGIKYAPPACATLKTNNLCRCGTDPLCNRVKHPVGYYSAMKRKQKKQPQPL
jgi:DNA primase large subunit